MNKSAAEEMVTIPWPVYERLGRLIETVNAQAEMIEQLTRERNEPVLRAERESEAKRRRAQVFRLPPRS